MLHRYLSVDAAIAGTGIVYLFEDWLRPHFDSGTLELVLEPWWLRFSGPFLYYPGRRLVPAPLFTFARHTKRTDANAPRLAMNCLTALKHGHEFADLSLSRLGLFDRADTIQDRVSISAAQPFKEGCSRWILFQRALKIGRHFGTAGRCVG
jgi:hypothetical protein